MSDHEGARAILGRSSAVRGAVFAAVVAGAALAGCDVIKPDLLADAAPILSAPPPDATIPHDSAAPPPDAYQPTMGNLVANPDFETQDKVGWITDGGGTIGVSTTNAHGGTKSLLTTERKDDWQGPATPITTKVRPGRKYEMSVFVRLMAAGTEGFNISLRHTCAEDSMQRFNEQTSQHPAMAMDGTTWVEPTSTFTVATADHCTLSEVLVYVETTTKLADGATYPSFYIDDIQVTEVYP
jgi:endo-1,4-beta-xylanase